MYKIILNIKCFLGIHNWADSGWLQWKKDTGILECSWCGKIKEDNSDGK